MPKAKTKAFAFKERPSWVPQQQWEDWLLYREEKGFPILSRATFNRAINCLVRYFKEGGDDPGLVLEQATDRGYRGLFPVSKSYRQERDMIENDHKVLIEKDEMDPARLRKKIEQLADRSWADEPVNMIDE